MTNLAASATPLGQLQRGLGSGFLWALEQQRAVIRPLLTQCILNDPRWDRQIDERGDYYAQLMLAAEMPLSPLELHLEKHDDGWWDTSLVIEVLGGLAKRGHEEAIGILRAYVASGNDVSMALEMLAGTGKATAWEGLDWVVAARFQDPEELECKIYWRERSKPPWWDEWIRSPTLVSKVLRKRGPRRPKEPGAEYAPMTTAELLELACQANRDEVSKVLASRVSPQDNAALLGALDNSAPWRAIVALRVLRPRRDVRIFDPARRIVEQWKGGWTRTGRRKGRHPMLLRVQAIWAINELPTELVLPLARTWRFSARPLLRAAAHHLLEHHLTADDVPWIRKQLGREVTSGRIYAFCGYAEMLSKFPKHGPFPVLRRIFREFPYSYGRRYLAEAMAATDPAFAQGLAYDCLWDCQSDVRVIGAQSVDLGLSKARDRVSVLAHDERECDCVREAARARLS